MSDGVYNPLDKLNLAKSIEAKLLAAVAAPLATAGGIQGAGVYVIYYAGDFVAYAPISKANESGNFTQPIYIGKAIPKGGRKGGISADVAKSRALGDRLGQHAVSVAQAGNLDVSHFFVRHLVVDDIWIPLGENMLIETFKPLWNRAIDGFGNKDPGTRRSTQYKSPWDVLHPGRSFADKLANGPLTATFLLQRVSDYLAAGPLAKLPQAISDQIAAEKREVEDSADET